MSPLVNTALGPIETSRLGFTLMHEHVVIQSPGLRDNWPETFDRAEVLEHAAGKLREARAHGVETMVDLTTVDLGRDIPLVAEIAGRAEMQVIVATGLHINPPRYFHNRPVDVATRLFVRDIIEGVHGTAVKAGVIKLACNYPTVEGPFEIAFRAGARAHRQTGVPISTHTDSLQRSGLDQQRILAEEGVDLGRVVIGHSGDTEDVDYLERLLERGSYLGMDRFGLDHFGGQELLTTPRRVRVIAELCRRGYADRMVLSHDASAYADPREPAYTERTWPNWRFTHIPREVLPALLEAGVSQAQIDQMARHNPRAIFERQGAY
ncbi:MAG: phosphotriesterase-related protein [Chloroflexota bacterium]|nr:phosphotriesterase-related protein [Chloroflexota bacterium]